MLNPGTLRKYNNKVGKKLVTHQRGGAGREVQADVADQLERLLRLAQVGDGGDLKIRKDR